MRVSCGGQRRGRRKEPHTHHQIHETCHNATQRHALEGVGLCAAARSIDAVGGHEDIRGGGGAEQRKEDGAAHGKQPAKTYALTTFVMAARAPALLLLLSLLALAAAEGKPAVQVRVKAGDTEGKEGCCCLVCGLPCHIVEVCAHRASAAACASPTATARMASAISVATTARATLPAGARRDRGL